MVSRSRLDAACGGGLIFPVRDYVIFDLAQEPRLSKELPSRNEKGIWFAMRILLAILMCP